MNNPLKTNKKILNPMLKLQCWWFMCACLTALLWSLLGPTWRLSIGDHKVDLCSSWLMEAELSHHMAWFHRSTWPHESLNLCGHILLGTVQKKEQLLCYLLFIQTAVCIVYSYVIQPTKQYFLKGSPNYASTEVQESDVEKSRVVIQ